MAEGSLASAVALPDQDPLPLSPESGLKRRKSSVSEVDSKRRRLSSHDENERPQSHRDRRPSSPVPTDHNAERKPRRGREEERKRGQRLFGGLLGTLSQGSSNSAAQRRRADIERRQQDKLKLQDEEYGELKKKRRDDRMVMRKKDKRLYEEESMHTRHANLLAMAHFLKTKTTPVLYYKPWQLRSENENVIRDQIEEAEATIAREVADFENHNPPPAEDEGPKTQKESGEETVPGQEQAPLPDTQPKEPKEETTHEEEVAGTANTDTNHDKGAEATAGTGTDGTTEDPSSTAAVPDVHRGAEDDGGEVVEDQEDTVIY